MAVSLLRIYHGGAECYRVLQVAFTENCFLGVEVLTAANLYIRSYLSCAGGDCCQRRASQIKHVKRCVFVNFFTLLTFYFFLQCHFFLYFACQKKERKILTYT